MERKEKHIAEESKPELLMQMVDEIIRHYGKIYYMICLSAVMMAIGGSLSTNTELSVWAHISAVIILIAGCTLSLCTILVMFLTNGRLRGFRENIKEIFEQQ